MLLALAVAAAMTTIDVPDTLGGTLDDVKDRSEIAVLVPEKLRTSFDRLYADQFSRRGFYVFELGSVKNCQGAGACSVAYFAGDEGGPVRGAVRVQLAQGRRGKFAPSACGANCSSPAVSWRQGGVAYEVASEELGRGRLVKVANSAIRSGPR